MGSAYATMNVSSINLPYWMPRITTSEEAEAALAIVKEHLRIIQQLRNSKERRDQKNTNFYASTAISFQGAT